MAMSWDVSRKQPDPAFRPRVAPRGAPFLLLACLPTGIALAAEAPPAPPEKLHWLVELKRQASERGTLEEATKTNLKLEYQPDGPVSLLRLELPFPDSKNTSLEGRPLDPEFGDAKIRLGFRAVQWAGRPWTSFLEFTFPTADPESQGTGKYQWSGGAKTAFPMGEGFAWFGPSRRSFSVQVQQVVSFAGDATRKDVNQTKFELELRDTWSGGHYGKATAKPVYDWVGGRDGAVLEVEGGWEVDRSWRLAMLAGGLLWGKGTPSTYQTRIELKAIYRF